jgi:hypothetical protein
MYNVVCRSMTIEMRYAAVRIELQAMYSAVYLEKFVLTETAGYLACRLLCDVDSDVPGSHLSPPHNWTKWFFTYLIGWNYTDSLQINSCSTQCDSKSEILNLFLRDQRSKSMTLPRLCGFRLVNLSIQDQGLSWKKHDLGLFMRWLEGNWRGNQKCVSRTAVMIRRDEDLTWLSWVKSDVFP